MLLRRAAVHVPEHHITMQEVYAFNSIGWQKKQVKVGQPRDIIIYHDAILYFQFIIKQDQFVFNVKRQTETKISEKKASLVLVSSVTYTGI